MTKKTQRILLYSLRRRAIIALYTRTIGRFRKTRQDFTVNFYFPSTMFTSDLYSFDINLDVTSGQDNDVSITFSAPSADSNDLLAVPFSATRKMQRTSSLYWTSFKHVT